MPSAFSLSPAPPSAMLTFRLQVAIEFGWTPTCLDPETGWLWQVTRDGRQHILYGSISPLNQAAASRLALDKFHTATVLRHHGLRVPTSARCLREGDYRSPDPDAPDPYVTHRGIAPALALAETHGFPLVVKPNEGSQGRGVTLVDTLDDLRQAITAIWRDDSIALAQRPLPGVDLRIDLLDGQFLLAYLRRPLQLIGTGQHSILELLRQTDPRARDPVFIHKIRTDPLWQQTLADAQLTETSVLPVGQPLRFAATILNLNRLCLADALATLPPGWVDLCARIARIMNLRHCGIDLRVCDIDAPLQSDPSDATILEVNASPSVVQIHRLGAAELAEAAERRVMEAALSL